MDDYKTFGRGSGPTSRLLYYHSLTLALERKPNLPNGTVYDLGGSNGLSRQHFDQRDVVTVDNNESTQPDIVADIRRWTVPTDAGMVLLRHVFHYLTSEDIVDVLKRLTVPALVIQFSNENTTVKQAQTPYETGKRFRTFNETEGLIYKGWNGTVEMLYRIDYNVEPEFYVERFGQPGISQHQETLTAWWLN